MEHLFWSGPRESDIAYTGNLFSGSATFYGSNCGKNRAYCGKSDMRVNHNEINEAASDFILNWQLEMIRRYPDCRFMSYNPNCVYGAPDAVVKRTVCLNDAAIMAQLDNKLTFREMAEGVVPLLPMRKLFGRECALDRLYTMDFFSGFHRFVVQEIVASGGNGTYLLSHESEEAVTKWLSPEKQYIVTGYLPDNIPVNLHAIIFQNEILLFPASIQIIHPSGNRLRYRGADFAAYHDIPVRCQEQFRQCARQLCQMLWQAGYRGVLGIDAMFAEEKLFVMEVNNRFQGSSILLNRALMENGLPSLQELNLCAFNGDAPDATFQNTLNGLDVPYSLFTFLHEMDSIHSNYIFSIAERENKVLSVIREGYDPKQPAAGYASEFALILKGNIVSLCEREKSTHLHPNIAPPSPEWYQRIMGQDWTAVKIALLNRGAVLSKAAKEYISCHGQMRQGTYCSLDLRVRDIYINCPLYVKLTGLSPFEIDATSDGLCLKYYGVELARAAYDIHKPFARETLSSGTPVSQIAFLATDRLRLQHSPVCTFAAHGVTCRFCEAEGIHNAFTDQDVMEAIDAIFQTAPLPFRHILLGGLSGDYGTERDIFLKICRHLRKYTDMPVYLMCLPPDDDTIVALYQAGVTEFGFNIEIFDRQLAKRYMPGKGAIPLERYLSAFRKAVSLVGREGAVRCAFIAGLEPLDSLLQGIETVCRIGVAPVLSVFRPIPGTELAQMVPPSDEWLYDLLEKTTQICRWYHLEPGPSCTACRNNTLTFVHPGEAKAYLINSQ